MVLCVFVEVIVTMMVLNILDSLKIQAATVSAVEEHQQAAYLADAGIQHAIAMLRKDSGFQGSFEWADAGTKSADPGIAKAYTVSVTTDKAGNTLVICRSAWNDVNHTQQATYHLNKQDLSP